MTSVHERHQLLGAFIDNSLDTPQRLAVQALLEEEATLRCELRDILRVRAAIRANAQHFTAPAALRARVRAGAAAPTRRARWAGFGRWQWPDWGELSGWRPLGAAMALAVLMVWSASLVPWPSRSNEQFMQAAVTSHLRATTGPRLVDIASSDRSAIQPWLVERLAFSAPVMVPAGAQADLVGARTDNLEGRAVAAVVYRLRDHVVNTFIWPATDDAATITSASVAGLSVSHWSRGGLRYCVVSDLPKAQVIAFAESLAQEDESR